MKEISLQNQHTTKDWMPKAVPTDYSLSINDGDIQRILREESQRIEELETILNSMSCTTTQRTINTAPLPSDANTNYCDDLERNEGTFNYPPAPWHSFL